ncbi:MAG: cysteine desulfurase CsdA [Bacteroidetes bacterium CG12_big_fil_rev_8_21_14_0_65_60_17]|nr:MAG: cysteine desulfurase CsdA [Bacteroidetes bacterium CG12_big_fil_rev_8_21_14_0_65_60_17]
MDPATLPRIDPDTLRADFPALSTHVYDTTVAYLDNAATAQKPRAVIDRISRYYESENANVHRGVHAMSQVATNAYEGARAGIGAFLGVDDVGEIVFTRGTTEAINLVASSWGRLHLHPGANVVVTEMEHHSNIVPWQLICQETGASLRVVRVTDEGEIDYEDYERALAEGAALVSIVHVSNTLGTINPVERMIDDAHGLGVPVLVDGAQAVPHGPVDVKALGCDFYCFSSHKLFGPTGFGVLYGRRELLESMPPWQGGGDMIEEVDFDGTTYNHLPHKFEAGTPHIAGAIGLAAAIAYVRGVGFDTIQQVEADLLAYTVERLGDIGGIRFVGTARRKTSVVSFLVGETHPYDVGSILDRLGVAVRTGHHCTQPLMKRLGIPGTVRASMSFYNTRGDIDRLAEGVERAAAMLS